MVAKTDPWAPRPKSEKEYVDAASRILEELKGKRLDILLLHETPYYPELVPGLRENVGSLAARKVVEMIRPRVAIGGHAHLEPRVARLNDTLIVHLDSSQLKRSYLILETNDNIKITLYKDRKVIESMCLRR